MINKLFYLITNKYKMSRRTFRKKKPIDINDYEIKKRLNESSYENMITMCKNALSILGDTDKETDMINLALLTSFLNDNGPTFIKLYIKLIDKRTDILPESMMCASVTRKILLNIFKPDHTKQILTNDLSNIGRYLSINGIYTINVDTQVDKHKFMVITDNQQSIYIGSYGIYDKFVVYRTESSKLISYIQHAYQDPDIHGLKLNSSISSNSNLLSKRIAMNLLLTNMNNKEYYTDDFVADKCVRFKLKRTNLEIKDFNQRKIDNIRLKFHELAKESRGTDNEFNSETLIAIINC